MRRGPARSQAGPAPAIRPARHHPPSERPEARSGGPLHPALSKHQHQAGCAGDAQHTCDGPGGASGTGPARSCACLCSLLRGAPVSVDAGRTSCSQALAHRVGDLITIEVSAEREQHGERGQRTAADSHVIPIVAIEIGDTQCAALRVWRPGLGECPRAGSTASVLLTRSPRPRWMPRAWARRPARSVHRRLPRPRGPPGP